MTRTVASSDSSLQSGPRDASAGRVTAAFTHLFRPLGAIALLAGAVVVQTLPALPPLWVDAVLGIAGILLMFRIPSARWIGLVLVAAAWTMLRADVALSRRLAPELEGADLTVTGTVRGLPRVGDEATRFDFVVRSAERGGKALDLAGIVRLGWYDTAPPIAPCSIWNLRVRLKRPRGLVDPGAFDFERYALSEGIVATGYVREDARNRNTGERLLCADRLRERISSGIAATLGPGPQSDVLRALAFGDQHAMDEHEWQVARATGIPHLIAISGLHIALFAGFGVWIVRLLWKAAPGLTLRWPAPLIEAAASIVFATAYAAMSGLGLPTRRALVMIGVLLAATLARRARGPAQGLAFAIIVLLAVDPLCVLSAGFWLSFVGVAWLMFCLGGRRAGAQVPRRPGMAESGRRAGAQVPRRQGMAESGSNGQGRWWRELVQAQGVASLGLLPLTIWFFGQSSLIGPLANLVAVPWICLVVLPLGVAGALLQLAVPLIGVPLLQLAGAALGWLWMLLEKLAAWPGAIWYFPEPAPWALALAMAGALWLLLPRGIPARALGLLLLLPLLVPPGQALGDNEFEALMLDVGQGLSVVVRTRGHTLVYDAGARFPSGFDLGDVAVVPALHAIGVNQIDRLIVSHGDNDHAGGAAALAAAFSMPVESGEPGRLAIPAIQCLAGESWQWDGVTFRIVHPREPLAAAANDRCCVLEVRSGDNALVLTGDISADVEPAAAEALAPVAGQLVLQVPHHGSRSSSSNAFIDALQPRLALVSAGYRNHFNHPSPAVVQRYASAGVEMLNTSQSGFITVRFPRNAPPRVVERGRIDGHPYWRER